MDIKPSQMQHVIDTTINKTRSSKAVLFAFRSLFTLCWYNLPASCLADLMPYALVVARVSVCLQQTAVALTWLFVVISYARCRGFGGTHCVYMQYCIDIWISGMCFVLVW